MADGPPVEVKSSVDEAWQEAQLDVSDGKLVAKVVSFDDETVTFGGKDEIMARVRFVSEQVKDNEAAEVKVGDKLCVLNNSSTFSRYYDAEVMKVELHGMVKKGGTEICDGEFLVKWLSGPDKGETSVVGCECLCHISTKPIDSHPTVAKVLS